MESNQNKAYHMNSLARALRQMAQMAGTVSTAAEEITAESAHRLVALFQKLVLDKKSSADETKAVKEKILTELQDMDGEAQKELEQAIIMSACPGSPTCVNPPGFPQKVVWRLWKLLDENGRRRLGYLMERLGGTDGKGGEAHLLLTSALLLKNFLPEEGEKEWNPECFRVDHKKPLGENIAVGFLNGFLPRRKDELEKLLQALENPEEELSVNVNEEQKRGLALWVPAINDMTNTLPKRLPPWAWKLYDAARVKRTKPQEAQVPATESAGKPTKTKKTQEPEFAVVTKIKTFISARGLQLEEGARKSIIMAISEIKKGGAVAEPLRWLTAAQKGLPDEIAKELDTLMEGVREHYHQKKTSAEASKPTTESAPTILGQAGKPAVVPKEAVKAAGPKPLAKDDISVMNNDPEVVRWIKEQVLLAKWHEMDDAAHREVLGLCVAVKCKASPPVVKRLVENLTKTLPKLGELFAEVDARLREHFKPKEEEPKVPTILSEQAEVPATKSEPMPEAPIAAEKVVTQPKKPSPAEAAPHKGSRFKWEDFADEKGDEEIATTLKVFARSNRNALGKPAGGHLKKAMDAMKTEGVVTVLKHVRSAIKAAGGHKLGDAFNKLEKAINEYYEMKELEAAPANIAAAAPAPETK